MAAITPWVHSVGHEEGRVVLVTGGTRGIGLAIAQAFATQGDRVAVTYRKEPVASFLSLRCDVTSGADVDTAFAEVEAKLGPVEILVANAGITNDRLLIQMNEDAFTSVLDTNLVAAGPMRTLAAKSIAGFPAFEDVWNERAPLGWDVTDSSAVAKACVALLSDWFPLTTGEMVHVDGGYHAVGA